MKPSSSRPEGCLSDFALDRLLAKELDTASAAATDAHLAECERCSARADELRRARDVFAREAPPLRALPPKGRRRWPVMVSGALAFAAALALLVAFRRPGDGEGTRSKGDVAKLGFYVNHGGSVRAGGPGERVAPSDGLQFVVTAREARYLAVLSVDGMHHASTYYPSTGDAARVSEGNAVPLPASTSLDDTLGEETIYGIFCPRPFAPEPLRRALEASPDRVPAPDGCTVDVVHLRKEAAAGP